MNTINHSTITITPAILTTDQKDLVAILQRDLDFGFSVIDIDIQEQPFASNPTLDFEHSFAAVSKMTLPHSLSLGWDLKLAQPQQAVERILAHAAKAGIKTRIYVYSNADIAFVKSVDLKKHHIGLALLGTEELPELPVYNDFPEVQLMTITVERQGAELDPSRLRRSIKMREDGYRGIISIDGGVNAKTAPLIAEMPLERVCVGSYFQKAPDLAAAYETLRSAFVGRNAV